MTEIEVHMKSETELNYLLGVSVSEGGSTTQHLVTLDNEDYENLAGGRSPEDLIKKSFEFLLEREAKEAILRSFNVKVISQYFPEFKKVITS